MTNLLARQKSLPQEPLYEVVDDEIEKLKTISRRRRKCSLPALVSIAPRLKGYKKLKNKNCEANGEISEVMEQLIFDLHLNSPSKPHRQQKAVQNYENCKRNGTKFTF